MFYVECEIFSYIEGPVLPSLKSGTTVLNLTTFKIKPSSAKAKCGA